MSASKGFTPCRSAAPITAAQRSVLRELEAFHTFSRIELQTGTGLHGAALDKVLDALERRGMVVVCSNDEYMLTRDGLAEIHR